MSNSISDILAVFKAVIEHHQVELSSDEGWRGQPTTILDVDVQS